jgi:hypothetical protein
MALTLEPVLAAAQDLRDASVAKALFAEARQAAGLGDWESALVFLAEARAQDPGDADILYLSALATVKKGLALGEALGSLDAALATGRFSYYDKRDASTLKAELLLRERRWKEALEALGPYEPGRGADPAFRLIRARAFAGLGDLRAFMAEETQAVKLFPDNGAFARLFVTRAGLFPASAEERELGDLILSRLTRYADSDPELPVLAAPLMADIAARRDTVLAYRSSGGSSNAATLRALEYGLIDEATASSELLSGAHPVYLADLSSLLALAGSPNGRDKVEKALFAWSGEILVDSDSDGIAEASFSIVKGLATGWKLDEGQDGVYEHRAAFADGLPSAITIEREGIAIEVLYGAYPAVSSVSFTKKGERSSFAFSPEAFSYAPIAMRAFSGEGRSTLLFPYANSLADPNERSCATSALSVITETGSSRTVTSLDRGLPISSSAYEGGILHSTTSYSRGSPVLERIDADGDGRFETEHGYSADAEGGARLSWVREDGDGDGVFEYREQLQFPFRKEWDYDGNGSIDALQFQLADGSIEREFSSRLDDRLDEAIVVKSGRIISLSRNGLAQPLLPDSNPLLTWIGEKPFDLGRNLPAGEGFFTTMGRRYRLTRLGDLAFAELVQ